MTILDGKKISNDIKDEITQVVAQMKANGQKTPHLAAVIVGEDGASLTYVGSKVSACARVGFESTLVQLPAEITQEELLAKIDQLNNDSEIDGFIVQLPLPRHIDTQKVLLAVDPKKDVDGFHPENFGKLALIWKLLFQLHLLALWNYCVATKLKPVASTLWLLGEAILSVVRSASS